MRYFILLSLLLTCSCSESCKYVEDDGYSFGAHRVEPVGGLVRSPSDAAAIAEVVAKRLYGIDKIERQKPFIVSTKNDIWYVRGSQKEYAPGGVVEVEILRLDSRVIRISHGK